MGLPAHEEEAFARIAAGLPDLDELAGPSMLHPSLMRAVVSSIIVIVVGNALMMLSIAAGAWPLAVPCFLMITGLVSGIWLRQSLRAADRRRLLHDVRS